MQTEIVVGYELEIEDFKGPLDKLLELIGEKKLEITRLNLAEVTADFLAYLSKLEEVSHRELANFIVVAARLVLIKSHALLPNLELTTEEEQDIAELEKRLRLYQKFRGVEEIIGSLWNRNRSFVRPFLATTPAGFYLSEKLTPKDIQAHFKRLVEVIEDIKKLETKEVKVINLEEKIIELVARIGSIVRISFGDLKKEKDKPEIVVMFLALLHLVKDNRIEIYQEDVFGDISISSITNG